jgi:hypothetical protein
MFVAMISVISEPRSTGTGNLPTTALQAPFRHRSLKIYEFRERLAHLIKAICNSSTLSNARAFQLLSNSSSFLFEILPIFTRRPKRANDFLASGLHCP